MTKQADEVTLKGHLPLEGANKIIESTTEMVCNEALVICSAHVKPMEESVPKIAPVKISLGSLRSKVERIMHKLYDLESDGEPEKPLDIDLDLYQMENY